ncbi:MAG: EscJ/YscJ/HrcJ family type III secretion inner membrane ring protein [Burkholderiales bacterium RIFCSPLOWO2_02_FULL_57_36]|nr:MAG: EscJ/YscJ/HrcJ family type III secretion inner membrane ring protein [Burkholderiales bacterium RIFCSPLOWO2_02_FULL_57_36]
MSTLNFFGSGRAGTSLGRAADALTRLCLWCVVGVLCACNNPVNLQTGLNDGDANEIVSILNRNGIEAAKLTSKNGVTLTVKDTDISRATDVMREAGLPRRSLSSLGQVFKKEGMISTPLEERVRYIHGLSQELENTLGQFDNVVAARVHVVLPERIAPGEPIQPSSAAVFVKYREPFDEDTSIPRIRHLVASSIPGLSGEEGLSKVSVVTTPTKSIRPSVEWTSVGPFYVQAGSANLLIGTLFGLIVFAGACLIAMLSALAMRSPKVADAMRKRLGKVPAFPPRDENAGIGVRTRPQNDLG